MTTRTAVVASIASAAALAGAAPLVGQMTHPAGAAASAMNDVVINDAGYTPAETVVAPGQVVMWTNKGSQPHTVTADDASFDSGTLQRSATFQFTAPAVNGTYAYHCTFHSFMHGTVVVSTVTLSGPKSVVVGKGAAVHGVVPGGVAGTPVSIERLVGATWTPVAGTALAADGSYAVTVPALKATAELRAHVGNDISPTLDVPVAPKVTVKKKAGAKNTITVTLKPAAAAKGRVERLNTDTFRWKSVKSFAVPRSGRATVKVPGAGSFRVRILATTTLGEATSHTVKFR